MNDKPKSNRGFAAMAPERRCELASQGGKSVDPAKRAFALNRDLASAAAKKRFQKEPTK